MKRVSFVRTNEELASRAVLCESCRTFIADTPEDGTRYRNPLSLDSYLVDNPTATYFVEVGVDESISFGENTYLGVLNGDVLAIDRSRTPTIGALVLAVCDGTFRLSRYTEHEGKKYLVHGEKPNMKTELAGGSTVFVWGVVSALGRKL